MPVSCTICSHPDRSAIERDLVSGVSYRTVARRYGVSPSSLVRHKREHLVALAGAVQDPTARAATVSQAEDLLARLADSLDEVTRLFDACKDWLTDPDDPTRYDLSPRAEELTVVYTTPGPNGRRLRHKATLACLLAVAVERQGDDAEFVRLTGRQADPRELILKTARRLEVQVQILASLMDRLQQTAPAEEGLLSTWEEWCQLRTIMLNALEPFPDAKWAIADALSKTPYLGNPDMPGQASFPSHTGAQY